MCQRSGPNNSAIVSLVCTMYFAFTLSPIHPFWLLWVSENAHHVVSFCSAVVFPPVLLDSHYIYLPPFHSCMFGWPSSPTISSTLWIQWANSHFRKEVVSNYFSKIVQILLCIFQNLKSCIDTLYNIDSKLKCIWNVALVLGLGNNIAQKYGHIIQYRNLSQYSFTFNG